MKAFILGTFGLLGLSFYVMSGGSDFQPEQRDVALLEIAPDVNVVAEPIVTTEVASLVTLATPTPEPVAEVIEVAVVEEIVEPEPVIEIVEAALDLRAVSGNVVNMRAGPGTDYSVLAKLNSGTQTEVIEVDPSGWARIKVVGTGQIGWMTERFLTQL